MSPIPTGRGETFSTGLGKMPPKHRVTVTKQGNATEFLQRINRVGSLATYVGIPPSTTRGRTLALAKKASKFTSSRTKSKKAKSLIQSLVQLNDMNNATLLYIFSRGSMVNHQPPRPVIEAAIQADGNRQKISDKVAEAINTFSKGRSYESKVLLTSAGALAAKLSRDWFFDDRNGWADNAASTLRGKNNSDPGVMTGIMRAAITHVEKEVSDE
jgi:hypothetical protein